MYLKLTHRRYYGDRAEARPDAAIALLDDEYESPTFKRVSAHLARGAGHSVLDLGIVNGETVNTLGATGARVFVHDLVTPLCGQLAAGKIDVDALLEGLDFLPESVDVIFAWEIFALLPPESAQKLLSRMSGWLRPRGLVMGVFQTEASNQSRRFRLQADGVVKIEEVLGLPDSLEPVTNNDVMVLFSNFTLVHSALVRTRLREVLVQRRDG
ncbi:MAG: class I SAM-dependent methyltransferase [Leptospirillia bacterium]